MIIVTIKRVVDFIKDIMYWVLMFFPLIAGIIGAIILAFCLGSSNMHYFGAVAMVLAGFIIEVKWAELLMDWVHS